MAAGAAPLVAFVDIQMPGWDGVRTVRELWKVDPRIQIVLCTAYADYTWEALEEALGPSDSYLVLKKPFDTIEVRQIASALTQKWLLLRERESRVTDLESEVRARTAELERALASLKTEMSERIRHAQKLETLGRVAAGVAHEINNPLAYIMTNLDYCRTAMGDRSMHPPSSEMDALCEALDDAADGAEKIRRIVLDIRLFSHPREDALRAVELEPRINSVVRMLGADVRRRARLSLTLRDVPCVLADPHRLEQVLTNLVANAAQAVSKRTDGAQIEIETRAGAAGEVVIEVRDTGHGIAEEHLAKIFDPFFTTRAAGHGTGLGLAICRSIVESFGGRIEIESRVGYGTTARLRLRASAQSSLNLIESTLAKTGT
jgi:two-component system, NtrC family, sensor kinase